MEYSVDRRTVKRAIEILQKDNILGEKIIKTINPNKEDELITTEFYYLIAQPASEEQVCFSLGYHCRFLNALIASVKN